MTITKYIYFSECRCVLASENVWLLFVSETSEVRHQRKLVVHLLKPTDFISPILQDIINSDKCVHMRMECDRPLNDANSWTG